MYLSAERITVAHKAVQDTFEQTSVAWQAIPHWDTGDPGQIRVRSDNTYAPDVKYGDLSGPMRGESLELEPKFIRFAVSVAQAIAPTPDALLAAVIARTVHLASHVDQRVIGLLHRSQGDITTTYDINELLKAVIEARARLENAGYRAPSCLLTDTAGLIALNQLVDGLSMLQPVLDAANINSLYRVDEFTDGTKGGETNGGEGTNGGHETTGAEETEGGEGNTGASMYSGKMLLLGRRTRIPHGGAPAASCGEEPMDLAVSVPPSLEVVGETNDGNVELAVRIRFAPRLTDPNGIVGVVIT